MLLQLIHETRNKESMQQIIDYVGSNPNHLEELMNYFLGNNMNISQKTSWALGHIGEQQPELFKGYHQTFIDQLQLNHPHNAIKRNIVRMYQFIEIPEIHEGKFYELAMLFLLDPNEPIAVKAFSMRICEKIALKYPELIPELIQAIESITPNASSGVKNRAGHILKRLYKYSPN